MPPADARAEPPATGSKAGAAVRAAAAVAVHGVVVAGRSLDATLTEAGTAVREGDRALLRLLCYEALRHHWSLTAQVAALLSRPLKARDRVIESLLAIGILQLTDTRIAEHAAVTLTVEATRTLRRPQFASLVNAVLRRFLREGAPGAADEEAAYNHPRWMLERLKRDWPAHWQQIVAANNDRAPMWLRVNLKRTTRDAWARRMVDDAAPPATVAGLDAALCLAEPCAVDSLPGFAEGLVSVQDGGAQLAAPWLLANGGTRILDACAAPGGKTGHLLELAGPGGVLSAVDNDAGRLERVTENLRRLQLDATVLVADASKPDDWWDGTHYDRVLLDAPCSGSGVIRRHPDIRLLRRDSDIEALGAAQGRLLRALWRLVTPGGRLLYVTCSVFEKENDAVVRHFLNAHADAREDDVLPNNNIRALMCRKPVGYQLLPGTERLDGFYFACLQKST